MKFFRFFISIILFVAAFAIADSVSAATNVYYSVGQSAADLQTGTSTVTISSSTGLATFSSAQTGNIGVGDRLTVATSTVYYISGKASTSAWYVVTATGTLPEATSSAPVSSIKREYTSLAAAIAGAADANHLNATDLVAGDYVLNIPAYYDSGADTSAVTISGYTTGVINYIKIYTPTSASTEANNSQRHQGKWNVSNYHLNAGSYASELIITDEYVRVEGIQFYHTGSQNSNAGAVRFRYISTDSDIRFSNNVIYGNTVPGDSPNQHGLDLNLEANTGQNGKFKVWNNLIFGFSGISSNSISMGPDGTRYLYNNTVYNNTVDEDVVGILIGNGNDVLYNNISVGNVVDYLGTPNGSSSHNISADESSPNASYRYKAVVFIDPANNDFHLSLIDISAKNAGVDLSADVNLPIATDIDGQNRIGTWDVGADEGATAVYYSVGQNTSDHKTGLPTVTISSSTGLATFSVAQTAANMGVGDVITYGSDKCYIAAKASTTAWYCVTATGTMPVATTSASVTSIAHAYASLSAAEGGATDSTHLNTADLVAGNYQLNFSCYYDSGPDTAAVAVAGYTTGANNYIKIYTPNNTLTEANQSQRHQGKWDDRRYALNTVNVSYPYHPLTVFVTHLKIEGLQMVYGHDTAPTKYGISITGVAGGSSEITISDNIIKGDLAKTYADDAIHFENSGSINFVSKINNNVIYDTKGFCIRDTSYNIGGISGMHYIYNNTIYNCATYGISTRLGDGRVMSVKNNVVQNTINANYEGAFNASSSNNISQDATSPNAAYRNKAVAFADASNEDFHLSPTDTIAKGAGADLSADEDFAFNSDVDGQVRPSAVNPTWDIGADEGATAIYYSAGQNTSDHKTGSPRVTVAGGIATFTVAQTANNMGVGDVITYDSTEKCYISEKISSTTWRCTNKTGGQPTSLNNVPVNSITHAFVSLNSAIVNATTTSYLNTADLYAGNYQLNFPCYYDSGPDTVQARVSGYTTAEGNYIKIYAPNNATTEVNQSQRHQGKWDDTKYSLQSNPSNDAPLYVTVPNVWVDGIQSYKTGSSYGSIGFSTASGNVKLSNSIARGVGNMNNVGLSGAGSNYVWNNIVYGNTTGSGLYTNNSAGTFYVYNNTVYGIPYAVSNNWGTVIAKNNIVQGTSDGFYIGGGGIFSPSSDYNISDLAADAPGVNSKNSITVQFADATNKDFHLSSSDTAAKNAGADLSADDNFSFSADIDGQMRLSSLGWDIGADEAANAVYYSVGQTTADLQAGTSTVTIASGTATFSAAQTGNIGVGDRVTIATSTVVYISGKISQSQWSVVTATGTLPAATTSAPVTSINREYTSLSAAVAGVSDVNHLNASDLVAANVQLNLSAYYDSGPDAAAVIVSGYATGNINNIKIFTPSNTLMESNNSQRHQGRWDERKYSLDNNSVYVDTLEDKTPHVTIDGLQLYNNKTYKSVFSFTFPNSGASSVIKNSILKSNNNSEISGVYSTGWMNTFYVYNNVFVDVSTAITRLDGNMYIYNNTILNAKEYGVYSGGWRVGMIKNNIVQGSGVNYSGTFDASSTNNISQDATSPSASLRNKTVSFADVANDDFHLSPTDASAKNVGADLSADANLALNVDIDGQARSGTWDIGADEAATAVYYSVGQNIADHKTGSPTVTIASGTATFSTAQTATNMGVGDKVIYNTSSIAYISEKISTAQWKLVTALGATPANVSGQAVNSIEHAFASLEGAIDGNNANGAFDSAHLNTANLHAGNYQLNIPCYNDSGPDENPVYVRGWTTAVSNYIRVYAPYDVLSEVNQSQRHKGKAGTGFLLTSADAGRTFLNYASYIRVEGLEINNTGAGTSLQTVDTVIGSDIRLGYDIFNKKVHLSKYSPSVGSNKLFIFNVIDSFTGDFIDLPANSGVNLHVYSSTLMGRSIIRDNNTAHYYNNIINSADAFLAVGTYAGTAVIGQNNSLQEATTSGMSSCTNCKVGQTFSFVDEGANDFHLASTDTAARKAGINLQNDPYLHFSNDIDGQERAGDWDIGADEFQEVVAQSPRASLNLDAGLVGHWTFDAKDVNGNVANDTSGNDNNGTISSGTLTKAIGRTGQGWSLDGTNYINAGDPASGILDFGTGDFAISTWIKAGDLSGFYSPVIDKGDNIAGSCAFTRKGYEFGFYYAKPRITLCDAVAGKSAEAGSPSNISANSWHHLVAVRSGANLALYADGVSVATTTGADFDINSSNNFRIGGTLAFPTYNFKGAIDDVRVYNRTLSDNEIGMLYHQGIDTIATPEASRGNADGLVGYWPFDGKTVNGVTASDLSGYNNNGTTTGATPAVGKIGQGMSFDGTNDRINVTNVGNFPDHTLSAWVNIPQSQSSWSRIVNYGNRRGSLMINSGTSDVRYYTDEGSSSAYTLTLNEWHLVSATRSENNIILYIDGIQRGVGSTTANSGSSLYIGAENDASYFFNGKIDEVRIYSRALSAQEIGGLYNAGKVQIRK